MAIENTLNLGIPVKKEFNNPPQKMKTEFGTPPKKIKTDFGTPPKKPKTDFGFPPKKPKTNFGTPPKNPNMGSGGTAFKMPETDFEASSKIDEQITKSADGATCTCNVCGKVLSCMSSARRHYKTTHEVSFFLKSTGCLIVNLTK